jgi:heptosyltransferase-3
MIRSDSSQLSCSQPLEKRACFLVARNLGDAVIQFRFIEQLVNREYADKYIIWTRPQVAFLYKKLPRCEVIESSFPVGTDKQFGLKGIIGFIKALKRLRHLKPTVTVDMIGDFRELLFARLIGRQKHLYIAWSKDHTFSRIIRNPIKRSKPVCLIHKEISNIYDAYKIFTDHISNASSENNTNTLAVELSNKKPIKRVGLHPFASQKCKLWPGKNWKELAKWLINNNISVIVYGSKKERKSIDKIFGDISQRMEIVTAGIEGFYTDVSKLDLMIGLDSLSVHIAEINNIRSIMINACNHPQLWVPPLSESISQSGGCKSYPCLNKPVCIGSKEEFACIKSIEVDEITKKILKYVG